MAGPNGAGKTTFSEQYRRVRPGIYLSAAALAQKIDTTHPERARIAAGRRFFERFDTYVSAGDDLAVESTLSGLGARRALERARARGYGIDIVFVSLRSAELCVARVEERVRKGGHAIPERDVIRRYHRSKRNFWHVYRPLADTWQLYDNGADGFRGVAMGQGEHVVVSDDALFDLFMQDVGGHASS